MSPTAYTPINTLTLPLSRPQYQAHSAIDQTAYMDARKKYHKTAFTSLPEKEQLDVRNMSKTL
jgi:hypothetical protein